MHFLDEKKGPVVGLQRITVGVKRAAFLHSVRGAAIVWRVILSFTSAPLSAVHFAHVTYSDDADVRVATCTAGHVVNGLV